MAYLGRITPEEFQKLAPNHPFAQPFAIIIGGQRPPRCKAPLPIGQHGVTVYVSWGYELYSVDVAADQWSCIRQGEAVMIQNIGWYEGKSFNCYWMFNMNPDYSLVVDYGEDGGTGFNGNIRDALIEEMVP